MEEKKKRWRPSLTAYRALEGELKALREKNATLEQSNGHMENELVRLREKMSDITRAWIERGEKIEKLRARSLWQRIINS